jgi:WD40 repeat protein
MVLPLQTETQIWELLAQVLPLLQALHEQGRIHGDIKPATSLQRSPVQLLDLLNLERTQPIEFSKAITMGSAEYIAPEQLQGELIAASDLYSLGMACIYWLTGVSPFDWLATPSEWTAYLLEPISPSLQRLLTTLTAPTIQDRYQSVDEVYQAMALAGAAIAPSSQLQRFHPGKLTPPRCVQVLRGLTSAVHAVALHSEGWVFSGTADGQVQRWNLDRSELEEAIAAHRKPVTDLALSPNAAHRASSSDDCKVQLWHREELTTLSGHTHCVKSVAFSPDGAVLASGSWDKTIKLWSVLSDVPTEEPLATLTKHRLGVNAVAFYPQGVILASGGLDCEILIWDWRSLQFLQCLTGHIRAVTALAFSPNGQYLASGSDDGMIRLWQRTNQLRFSLEKTLSAHSWKVSSLAFSLTGTVLFSGSWDHTIKIWDMVTGQETCILKGHTDSITAIALDESRQLLASSSRDQTIRLWEIQQFCSS